MVEGVGKRASDGAEKGRNFEKEVWGQEWVIMYVYYSY